jgi:DNA-binding GntR family transcriptional regulator
MVVSGEVEPGARLSELPLARHFGVSRPTIREALQRLESHGLARTDGRSLRVVQLRPGELRSALLMRSALEALHAELAANRTGEGEVAPAELRRLALLAERAEQATLRGLHGEAVQINRSFHQAIDSLADSPISARTLARLWDQILVSTERSLLGPGRGGAVNDEHRDLLSAIEAGDGARAADVARRHVLGTLDAVQDVGSALP